MCLLPLSALGMSQESRTTGSNSHSLIKESRDGVGSGSSEDSVKTKNTLSRVETLKFGSHDSIQSCSHIRPGEQLGTISWS